MTPFSVLMSVYRNDKPEFLHRAIESVTTEQTLKPSEIILMVDGPISDSLKDVIIKASERDPIIKPIWNKENQGLGKVLQEGLLLCSNELVARMDSDDICFPNRFEKQISYLNTHKDIAICGAWVNEFIGTTDNVYSQRRVPETHEDIKAFIKGRNPFNHPSVVFRKEAVLSAGGYQHFYLLEDWFLWARMLNNGCKMYNFQEPLLNFRVSKDMLKRRGGLKYAKSSIDLFKSFYKMNLINKREQILFGCIKVTVAIMPNWIRGMVYNKLLR